MGQLWSREQMLSNTIPLFLTPPWMPVQQISTSVSLHQLTFPVWRVWLMYQAGWAAPGHLGTSWFSVAQTPASSAYVAWGQEQDR